MDSDNTKLLNKIHSVQLETNKEIADLRLEFANTKGLDKRVTILEDSEKWKVRGIIGAVLTAVMALILK